MSALDYSSFLVKPGKRFSLSSIKPNDTLGLQDKDATLEQFRENRAKIVELQERLFAEGKQSLLFVLQAMDTAGKDSTIRKVMEGINPQGCDVTSFKAPSKEELEHDFLWRVHAHAPPKGLIGIFNRSHYEDVLIVRIHNWAPAELIEKRYGHINAFEEMLSDHGTRIVKVMLHVSKAYQRQRLRRRLQMPEKLWKFNPEDLKERDHWKDYMKVYEIALNRCSTPYAPWYVVPAENRWFRNLVISQILRDTLEDMNPQYPPPTFNPADFPPEKIV